MSFFDRDTTVICLRKIISSLREEGVRVFYSVNKSDKYYLYCKLYSKTNCIFEVGIPLIESEVQSFVDELNA